MAAPKYKAHDLDLELVFDRFLDASAFEVLQRQMLDLLPGWSCGLRVWRARQEKLPIDLGVPGSLGSIVTSAATERGPLYHALVARSGPPPSSGRPEQRSCVARPPRSRWSSRSMTNQRRSVRGETDG